MHESDHDPIRFEFTPDTPSLFGDFRGDELKKKDNSLYENILGPLHKINFPYEQPYKDIHKIPKENSKPLEMPILSRSSREKPVRFGEDFDYFVESSRPDMKVYTGWRDGIKDPDLGIFELQKLTVEDYRNRFPILSDLMPPITKDTVADIDPLTSPNYQLVALTLGVMVGREEFTPIYDQLHSEIYGVTE